MNIHFNKEIFNKREIAASIQIWDRAAVSLLDIRHSMIFSEDATWEYRLPASGFLYTMGAKAEVFLNDTSYQVQRYGLFHGSKGTLVTIKAIDGCMEYYMVLYKAGEPPFNKKEFVRLLTVTNPFLHQYGFIPDNPIFISKLLFNMKKVWQNPTPLERFYEKTGFYQLVYEVCRILDEEKIVPCVCDGVTIAKNYIKKHYQEEVSIESVAAIIGMSESHLRRTFKQRYGKSPKEYLIQARLDCAKELLETEKTSIKNIASASGFMDEFHFSKLFLKYVGMSPRDYRAKHTDLMNDCTMEKNISFPYNWEGQVSLDELKGKGEPYMLKQIRGKAIVAAALSLMLLTACSTTVNNKGGDSTPTPTVTSQAIKNDENEPVETGTRTINTTLGEVLVPVNPQRVVVQYLMGDVVALGITPVGVSDVYDGAAFSDLVTDSVSLGWFPEWEAESIMALEPDLILVIGKEDIEKFSKIAPTILVPYGDMTQNERITFMGEVLNRQEEAAAAIELYDTILEEGKTKLLEAGFDHYTVSVFEGGADAKMSVRGDQFGTASILYKELGIRAPKAVQENIIDKESGGEQVSFEVLADYSGDFIIRNTYEGMADLSENAIWNSIPAVVNNRVIGIEFGLSYYPDILSATAQLTFVTEELLEAAK